MSRQSVSTLVIQSVTAHAKEINDGVTWWQWLLSILAGLASIVIGAAVIKYLADGDKIIAGLGVLAIAYGLQIGSRGGFLRFVLVVRDVATAWRNPTPPTHSEDAQP